MSWRRLIWKTTHERLNPLTYAFLFATLSYGIGFTVFAHTQGVITSSIWASFFLVNSTLPVIWGIFAILSVVAWLLTLLTRREPFGTAASLLGFMVWLFASIVLASNSYWLVILSVAAPNMWYWGWFYFQVMDYKRQRDHGLIKEP